MSGINPTFKRLCSLKSLIVIFFVFIIFIYYRFFKHLSFISSFAKSMNNVTTLNMLTLNEELLSKAVPPSFASVQVNNYVEFRSQCNCRSETIYLKKTRNNYMILSSDENNMNLMNKYNVSTSDFQSSTLTCNLYNSLRRGPKLKVISYSLYGTHSLYYAFLERLVKRVYEYYPGWIIRVLYDGSINQSVICKLECMKKENSEEYYDNVDFCNIEELPYNLTATWNASYMHGMTWRWLPIGDSFIDFVNSRDTDAWIHQRELDSVNVWLNSNTLFHVMRDAPVHGIAIVGGYWGFANVRNRELATKLHNILTNTEIAYRYNHVKNRKGDDQFLLTDFFSRYSLKNSTTHDAFTCVQQGGDPWPTQRQESLGHCFVGCTGCCDLIPEKERTKYPHVCPLACRPKNHQDWTYC